MNQLPKSLVNGNKLVFDVEEEGCDQMAQASDRKGREGKSQSSGLSWESAGPLPTRWSRGDPVSSCLCTPFSRATLGVRAPIAHFLQVGGVYSYDCSFGHVPNVELMKFIAMATFGSYLSTCPEPEPGNLGLTVYHRAFLLYSFLRSGEALNPEYYCGERQTGVGVGTGQCRTG